MHHRGLVVPQLAAEEPLPRLGRGARVVARVRPPALHLHEGHGDREAAGVQPPHPQLYHVEAESSVPRLSPPIELYNVQPQVIRDAGRDVAEMLEELVEQQPADSVALVVGQDADVVDLGVRPLLAVPRRAPRVAVEAAAGDVPDDGAARLQRRVEDDGALLQVLPDPLRPKRLHPLVLVDPRIDGLVQPLVREGHLPAAALDAAYGGVVAQAGDGHPVAALLRSRVRYER
mmetsp:Transcript_86426/g.245026  ORF Transcript_86426/g.245026 Transcript_86426/m.245026 type:complete len:231 (+) Transcript_86426:245-937(+)